MEKFFVHFTQKFPIPTATYHLLFYYFLLEMTFFAEVYFVVFYIIIVMITSFLSVSTFFRLYSSECVDGYMSNKKLKVGVAI